MKLDTSTDPQVGFRPPGDLESGSALERYTGHFGPRQAGQLLRRAGFGGTPQEIDTAVNAGMDRAVDALLHPSASDDFPAYPDPELLYDDKRRYYASVMWWLDRMLRTKQPLVEKMTLFWHGHFATSIRKVPPIMMVQQINLFRSQALGNFRSLLLAVAQDPAMLIWLDNRQNFKAHPNENFAREVMELFALGLGNYTEDDVKNAARAFTGWTLDKNQNFIVRRNLHDDGVKTFLGQTGPFDGHDIINIILAQPVHSRYLCRKLLEYFVYSDPEPELIEGLARVYVLSGYDIAHVVGTILRSNVFHSTRAYRALPKSPVEFTIGLYRYLGIATVPPDTPGWLARMGQEPLAPPSVKGWDGGPAWISTATLLARFNLVNKLVRSAPPKGAVTPAAIYPSLTPDTIVQSAGGFDAAKVLDTIVTGAVQNDITSDVRSALLDYLNSKHASIPTPFGPENYQEKVRGALSLVLNLASNQLD